MTSQTNELTTKKSNKEHLLDSELVKAIRECNFPEVVLHLTLDSSIEGKTKDGSTLLQLLVDQSNNEMLKLFLNSKKIDVTGEEGARVVQRAAAVLGNKATVELLKKHGACFANPLEEIVFNNNLAELEERAEELAAYEKNTEKAYSLIHYACGGHAFEVLRWLCEKGGVDIDSRRKNGTTAVHHAAERNDDVILDTLHTLHADVAAVIPKGKFNALHLSASFGSDKVVKWFLTHRPDLIETKGEWFGRTALYISCNFKKFEITKLLLAHGADAKTCNKKGKPAFFIACESGGPDIIRDFVNKGASTETPCVDNGCTALHHMVEEAKFENVKCLLELGANVDSIKNDRISALDVAASCGAMIQELQLLTYMSQLGTIPIIDLKKAQNLLQYPSDKIQKRIEKFNTILKLLLDYDADVNKCNVVGATPLWNACLLGNLPAIKVLIQCGSNVNKRVLNMITPIFITLMFGYDKATLYLIEHGADAKFVISDNTTALHCAVLNSSDEVVKKLLDMGCDPFVTNNNGMSPLSAAKTIGRNDIVQLMIERTQTTHYSAVDKVEKPKISQGTHPLLLQTRFVKHPGYVALEQACSTEDLSKINLVTLVGIKGVGKTCTVEYFLETHRDQFTVIHKMDATSESSLKASFYSSLIVAKSRKQQTELTDEDDLLHRALIDLEHQPGWLLFFDNAKSFQCITPYLPRSGGHVIVSSTNHDWPMTVIEVLPFNDKHIDCGISIMDLFKIQGDVQDFKAVINRLDGLPLAIVQASSMMKKQNTSASQFLLELDQNPLKLYNFEPTLSPSYHTPFLTSITFSLYEIEQIDIHAIGLLNMCCLLSEKINLMLLARIYFGAHKDSIERTKEHLQVLIEYGLVSLCYDGIVSLCYDGIVVRVHLCVRETVRALLPETEVRRIVMSITDLSGVGSVVGQLNNYSGMMKSKLSFNADTVEELEFISSMKNLLLINMVDIHVAFHKFVPKLDDTGSYTKAFQICLQLGILYSEVCLLSEACAYFKESQSYLTLLLKHSNIFNKHYAHFLQSEFFKKLIKLPNSLLIQHSLPSYDLIARQILSEIEKIKKLLAKPENDSNFNQQPLYVLTINNLMLVFQINNNAELVGQLEEVVDLYLKQGYAFNEESFKAFCSVLQLFYMTKKYQIVIRVSNAMLSQKDIIIPIRLRKLLEHMVKISEMQLNASSEVSLYKQLDQILDSDIDQQLLKCRILYSSLLNEHRMAVAGFNIQSDYIPTDTDNLALLVQLGYVSIRLCLFAVKEDVKSRSLRSSPFFIASIQLLHLIKKNHPNLCQNASFIMSERCVYTMMIRADIENDEIVKWAQNCIRQRELQVSFLEMLFVKKIVYEIATQSLDTARRLCTEALIFGKEAEDVSPDFAGYIFDLAAIVLHIKLKNAPQQTLPTIMKSLPLILSKINLPIHVKSFENPIDVAGLLEKFIRNHQFAVAAELIKHVQHLTQESDSNHIQLSIAAIYALTNNEGAAFYHLEKAHKMEDPQNQFVAQMTRVMLSVHFKKNKEALQQIQCVLTENKVAQNFIVASRGFVELIYCALNVDPHEADTMLCNIEELALIYKAIVYFRDDNITVYQQCTELLVTSLYEKETYHHRESLLLAGHLFALNKHSAKEHDDCIAYVKLFDELVKLHRAHHFLTVRLDGLSIRVEYVNEIVEVQKLKQYAAIIDKICRAFSFAITVDCQCDHLIFKVVENNAQLGRPRLLCNLLDAISVNAFTWFQAQQFSSVSILGVFVITESIFVKHLAAKYQVPLKSVSRRERSVDDAPHQAPAILRTIAPLQNNLPPMPSDYEQILAFARQHELLFTDMQHEFSVKEQEEKMTEVSYSFRFFASNHSSPQPVQPDHRACNASSVVIHNMPGGVLDIENFQQRHPDELSEDTEYTSVRNEGKMRVKVYK